MKRRLIVLGVMTVIVSLGAYIQLRPGNAQAPNHQNSPKTTNQTKGTPEQPAPSFNKSQHSLTDPTSVWIVVNKQRRLQPAQYVPDNLVVPDIRLRSNITSDERQLRSDAAVALKTLSDAARSDGLTLTLESGYRSYNFQTNLYNRYVSQQGQAVADTQSARPGHSEHQTGLGADLGGITRPACNIEPCFADTPEGKWIAANAYKYGFIIRYPDGKTAVTGYIYEPWHLRYVGSALAAEMHTSGITTLEEFFGLPVAPDYN